MRILPLTILAIALLACTSAATPSDTAPQAKPEKLVVAVQPTGTPEQLASDAKEIETFLEARIGSEVDVVFPTTYAGVIEALRFGHAQAAFMSAWPAALAQKHAGAEVVLAEVRDVVIDGKKTEAPYYFSYWVVKKDSPIQSLQELKGKQVSFPSPLSTSGYVGPMARLVELGMLTPGGKEADPKQFFGQVFFSGGYAQSWEALKNGQVDATIIAGDVPEKLYREVLDNTRVIEQQGPLPSHSVVFSKDLKEPTRSKLKAALLEMGNPENRPLMRKFISGIFVSFKETTTQEHLGSLSRFLQMTELQFVERLK
ncbi:MAG: Phosphate/phosphite/phosphonate transporter substrate-binding protein [Dehalococcoidia bacterium]|nr:Phosphate/phosphite/phosphonate transporter substrate-binding protein [Dehalococcoidia bacterium]